MHLCVTTKFDCIEGKIRKKLRCLRLLYNTFSCTLTLSVACELGDEEKQKPNHF